MASEQAIATAWGVILPEKYDLSNDMMSAALDAAFPVMLREKIEAMGDDALSDLRMALDQTDRAMSPKRRTILLDAFGVTP